MASAAGIPCDEPETTDCGAIGCSQWINLQQPFACCSVENSESGCCMRSCFVAYCQRMGESGPEMCSGPHVDVTAGTLVPGTSFCDDSYDPVSGTYAQCVLESGEEGGGEGEGGD